MNGRVEKIEFQKVGGEVDNNFLYDLLVPPILYGPKFPAHMQLQEKKWEGMFWFSCSFVTS